MIERAALKTLGQVALLDPTRGIVVRIEVGTVLVRARAAPVAQVAGHLSARTLANLLQGGVNPRLRSVRLWRQGHVLDSLRKVDPTLGKTNDLGRLERGLGDEKRLRVRVANVLRGEDEDAARDELDVLARVDHARQPVERSVGIASAHGLDEGGDDVVVHVARLVVGQAAARICLQNVVARDAHGILRRGGTRRSRHLACQLK